MKENKWNLKENRRADEACGDGKLQKQSKVSLQLVSWCVCKKPQFNGVWVTQEELRREEESLRKKLKEDK